MMQELVLGGPRSDQQPLVGAAQGVDDVVEVVAIELQMARADHARLMVDLAERIVGFDALVLDVLGVEAEDMGFLGVHPDDGVAVRHA